MSSPIAERIRKLLADRGWSQRELARRGGFSTPSQVHNVLRNLDRDPGAVEHATIVRLAQGLEVSETWLLTGLDSTEPVPTQPNAPPGGSPSVVSIPGWEAAVTIARELEPSLPEAALERARRSAAQLTSAHATPELVIQLARLALRFAGPDLLDQVHTEGVARLVREKEAHEALWEHGTPLPPDVERDEPTEEGRRLPAEGKLKPGPPPTYVGTAAFEASKRAKAGKTEPTRLPDAEPPASQPARDRVAPSKGGKKARRG